MPQDNETGAPYSRHVQQSDRPGTPPNSAEAEVLYADRQWRPVTVLGWHRLNIAHRQAVTDRRIFWLVHLRLESGDEACIRACRFALRTSDGQRCW
jgi:hypothetical protein